MTVNQWISLILKDGLSLALNETEHNRLRHFLVTMIEQVWFTRNKVFKGEAFPDGSELSKVINSSHLK